jgi:UDP-N-acetylmuramyl pentapeptide synthase
MSARFTVADVSAALGRGPERPASPDETFTRIVIDSRRVQPGDLFVGLRGERHDGSAFLADAVRAGAIAAVGEDRRFEGRERIAFWPVADGRWPPIIARDWPRGWSG